MSNFQDYCTLDDELFRRRKEGSLTEEEEEVLGVKLEFLYWNLSEDEQEMVTDKAALLPPRPKAP